ncbi:toll/interleukin-1 receptor domain-containing protein [Pleomorphomonas sp. PLEO]|uniref:toll/interleukin-1 receptor domain-containing protein n=1 Tax=Pleomorphomonas sp. PLEO TaxID=3239306 RepID=UPI00351EBB78
MKVFISWSGKRSKALAVALKEWIPLILQYAKPWVSDKDISAGERWAKAIAGELEASNFGILCVTPENLTSEWILFEAGALSKSMLDAKVIPLLFGLELSDLSGPLSQFQALKVDQQGMMEVIKAINSVSENKAADETINKLVPALWPQFQDKLDGIPSNDEDEKHMRPQAEILEELVTQVRGLSARVREVDPETVERDFNYANQKKFEFDPRVLLDIMHSGIDPSDGDVAFLLIAGFIRDRMPWLAEILLETHRELKVASFQEANEIGRRLGRLMRTILRGPYAEKAFIRNKYDNILLKEMPHLIDRAMIYWFESRKLAVELRTDGEMSGAS